MFVLVEMVDIVWIFFWQFERKFNDFIVEELNKKLVNKVVYNVGFCICLFDIIKLEDVYVFFGDGVLYIKVYFCCVVFYLFLDEIFIGKIKGCSLEGVYVFLGFFDDIFIFLELLQQLVKFDEVEQVWVWEYEMEEGVYDFYMDIGEEICFWVVDESFVDMFFIGFSLVDVIIFSEELLKKEVLYMFVGFISELGLGFFFWWISNQFWGWIVDFISLWEGGMVGCEDNSS